MENQITKGKYGLGYQNKSAVVCDTENGKVITICRTTEESDAILVAETFNVTQETGKTPRQLADENKMLLEALILAKDLIVKLAPDDFTEAVLIENAKEGGNFDRIIKAINKATK